MGEKQSLTFRLRAIEAKLRLIRVVSFLDYNRLVESLILLSLESRPLFWCNNAWQCLIVDKRYEQQPFRKSLDKSFLGMKNRTGLSWSSIHIAGLSSTIIMHRRPIIFCFKALN